MKKLFNKALMFQNIHSIKLQTISLGILFGIISYFSINSNMKNFIYYAANLYEGISEFSTSTGLCILTMIFFITLIFIFMKGINKRESSAFFMSGPFTKRDIKKNEVLTLIFLVLYFSAILLYVIVCLTYKHRIQVKYIPDYYKFIFISIIRMLIVGILFSFYLSFMDLLFSNTIVSILAMVMFPIMAIFTVAILLEVILSDKILDYVIPFCYKYFTCMFIYFFGENSDLLHNTYFSFNKIFILCTMVSIMAIIILGILIYIISDKIKINNINNIFNFRIVETISIQFILFSIIMQILIIVIELKEYSISRIVNLVLITISYLVSNILRKFVVKKIDSYVN